MIKACMNDSDLGMLLWLPDLPIFHPAELSTEHNWYRLIFKAHSLKQLAGFIKDRVDFFFLASSLVTIRVVKISGL